MIDTLYIKITENCNLNCSFCYVKQEMNLITEEIISDAIIKFKPRQIVFHGGEPLLYPGLVLKTIKQYPLVIKNMTSNLTLPLTDERIQAISECHMATSYSVDRFNKEQFKLFCSNVKIVKDISDITLLVTLSKDQLMQEPKDLIETIKYIDPTNITFERLSSAQPIQGLYEQTDKYLSKVFDLADKNKNNLFQQMKTAIETNTPVFSRHCNCAVRTLNPDGSYCSCPNLYKEKNIILIKRRECLNCNMYSYCEGDCLSFQRECSFPKITFSKVMKEVI